VSYSAVVRLAELRRVSPEQRGIHELMIFRAFHGYMDETGTHADSEVVGVAGYLATYERWTAFENEWNQAMHLYCVDDFHMGEFEGHWNEFADNNYWTPDIRERLISRVCQMCQEHSVFGVGCVISRDQYETDLPTDMQTDLRDPYYYCLYSCMSMLLNYRNDDRLTNIKPINFLFDNKKGRFRLGNTMVTWEAFAQELYQRVKAGLDDTGEVLGELSFGKRQDYPQIRAADLLVYECGKLRRQWLNEPQRPLRKSMRALLKSQNMLITFQTAVKLRNFVRVVRGYQTGLSVADIRASCERDDPEARQMDDWMRAQLERSD